MADTRIHYLRKHTYTTRSNKIRKLRTPGGRLTIQYIKKKCKGPQTAFGVKTKLSGLKKLSNPDYWRSSRSSRRIARAYGGVITPTELKERILRSFLIEELKIVKKIIKNEKHIKKQEEKKPAEVKKTAEVKKPAPASKVQQKPQKGKGK